MRRESLYLEGIGEWEVIVPSTVYPPREDSKLLCKTVSELRGKAGKAMEIGCGSGIVSIVLASLGWDVYAIDVNPFAVSATRENLESFGLSERAIVEESGVLEGMKIPEDTELVVWNIPYLDRSPRDSVIGHMEEAGLSDIPERGWGGELLGILTKLQETLVPNLIVLLVLRTDPESSSKTSDWRDMGWSCRSLNYLRMGGEKIGVFAFWRTGFGNDARRIEVCNSTMDEAKKFGKGGWNRVFSNFQTDGRGRKGSTWSSNEGGMYGTWCLDPRVLDLISPGILQTSIGAIVSRELGALMKWPNDIVALDGKKMAGVLVESSQGESIRVGVGANRNSFENEDLSGSGWEGTLGSVDSEELFQRLDRSISSFFEETEVIPLPTSDYLLTLSWESLSRLLSRGAIVRKNGIHLRPVGLNKLGEIEAIGPSGKEVVSDIDEAEWSFRFFKEF